MKKNLYKCSLITIGIFALTLTGCNSSKKEPEVEVTATEATPTPSATITSEPTATPEQGLKDTEHPGVEEIVQTTPEDIQGEGITDGTVPDLSKISVAELATPIVFTAESGFDLFSLTINSIATITGHIEADIPDGDKAVLVYYDYENISSSNPLLFDDMSFKLIVDNAVCTPLFSIDLATAEIAEIGKTSVGQVAFFVGKDTKEVTLIFENAATNTHALFTANVD